MGSKHIPPRWWRPTLDEVCDRWDADRLYRQQQEVTFLSHSEFGYHTKDAWNIEMPKDDRPKITWQCWEEVGAQCLTLDGQPITPNMVTHIGMQILVPTLFCTIGVPETYDRAVITVENRAENESSAFSLLHDPVRGLVSAVQINKRAILKLVLLP